MEQYPQNPQQPFGQDAQSPYSQLPKEQNLNNPQSPLYPQNPQQPFRQSSLSSYAQLPKEQNLNNPQPSLYPQNLQQPFGQNVQPPAYPQILQDQYPNNAQSPLPPEHQRPQYQYNFTEKQMRRYFYKPANIFLVLAVTGGAFLLLGLMISVSSSSGGIAGSIAGLLFGGPFIFLGLVIGCVGGIPLYIHYSNRPTPKQYAAWVYERSQPLYKTAFQRLHLHESQCKSIVEVQGGISSMVQLTKRFPEKEIVLKRLPDGFRHYSINTCLYILLTEDAIAIYLGILMLSASMNVLRMRFAIITRISSRSQRAVQCF